MSSTMLLGIAAAAMIGGSVVLRRAWAAPRRSIAWNGAGWGLYVAGIGSGWAADGAWGVSIAALFGIAAALAFLAYAAITAPPGSPLRASNPRVGAVPQPGERWHLGRRVVTFMVTVLAAAIVSVGIALAVRAIVALLDGGEANAIVSGFFAMPLAWALLGYALLMEERRMRQWRLLALWAVPGVVATVAGLPG